MSERPAQRPVRVLIAKVGLDGHDRGARVVAAALRDAGMEVVYTGLRKTPEAVVRAADEEDVDAVGVSILSGAHGTVLPRVRALLDAADMHSVLLFAGGTIPPDDAAAMHAAGTVDAVFTPGASLKDIAEALREAVHARRAEAGSAEASRAEARRVEASRAETGRADGSGGS